MVFLKKVQTSESSSILSLPHQPPTSNTSTPLASASMAPSKDHFHLSGPPSGDVKVMLDEEEKAAQLNHKGDLVEKKKKRRGKKILTERERREQGQKLQDLLEQTAAFGEILTSRSNILGKVGTAIDGKKLGEEQDEKEEGAKIDMAPQPEAITGGTLRDYQLEGLTWMFELGLQGMSGILADEMGTGKTVQTISLVAMFRENQAYGPFLIIVPMSTLSNWINEFHRWAPTVPVVRYHGTPPERRDLFNTKLLANMEMVAIDESGRKKKKLPTPNFPVVVTTYEIIIRDRTSLNKIDWDVVVVDEGHRMKNFDSKLFRELSTFNSNVRLLLTGTPLQNNLRELWSLLNFLLPKIFSDWSQFQSWFDFDEDMEDEDGVDQFLENDENRDLIKKMHIILRPLMLRRLKSDVLTLPPKREYVLFAPMVPDQIELYRALKDCETTARAYLENKLFDHLSLSASTTPQSSRSTSVAPRAKRGVTSSKRSGTSTPTTATPVPPPAPNAFSLLMGKKKPAQASSTVAVRGPKRKSPPTSTASHSKSRKSSRHGTPVETPTTTTTSRGRQVRAQAAYTFSDASDDDKLSDDEFEDKLASQLAKVAADMAEEQGEKPLDDRGVLLQIAKREIKQKKLGNTLMQLRLACNGVHNFYDPFIDPQNESVRLPVDESIVTSSGKMLLLDRLLPTLVKKGHRVLIFTQFKTQLDILSDYCEQLKRWKYMRIDGEVAGDQRQELITEFNTNKDYKVFLLSTRAGGQGLNLTGADSVVLFDSDWNPQQDLQAQDRCHRIGQDRPVIVYRIVTKDTVEEALIMAAGAKRRLEKLVIKKGGLKNMVNNRTNGGGSGESGTMNGAAGSAKDAVDMEILKKLKERDGQVFEVKKGGEVISDDDLEVLCDRSEGAYQAAAKGMGDGNKKWSVVETRSDGTGIDSKGVKEEVV